MGEEQGRDLQCGRCGGNSVDQRSGMMSKGCLPVSLSNGGLGKKGLCKDPAPRHMPHGDPVAKILPETGLIPGSADNCHSEAATNLPIPKTHMVGPASPPG